MAARRAGSGILFSSYPSILRAWNLRRPTMDDMTYKSPTWKAVALLLPSRSLQIVRLPVPNAFRKLLFTPSHQVMAVSGSYISM